VVINMLVLSVTACMFVYQRLLFQISTVMFKSILSSLVSITDWF